MVCLLITVIAALASTIAWYFLDQRKAYRLGTLCCIYWGASLMWLVDAVFEYVELQAAYFAQAADQIRNDALLGVSVVVIGLIAWLIVLLVKDPKNVFKTIFYKR